MGPLGMAVMTYLEVLSLNLHEETEENNEKPVSVLADVQTMNLPYTSQKCYSLS